MRGVVHGSELAAATAAAALCSVGHQVTWMPHADFPWESLANADWVISEPGLKDQILAGQNSGNGIFDHTALLRHHTQAPGRQEEGIWGRLGLFHIL